MSLHNLQRGLKFRKDSMYQLHLREQELHADIGDETLGPIEIKLAELFKADNVYIRPLGVQYSLPDNDYRPLEDFDLFPEDAFLVQVGYKDISNPIKSFVVVPLFAEDFRIIQHYRNGNGNMAVNEAFKEGLDKFSEWFQSLF